MDVVDMPVEIGLIAQGMLPKPMLPYCLLTLAEPRAVCTHAQRWIAVLREPSLDESPAGREIRILRWQRSDAVQVIRAPETA